MKLGEIWKTVTLTLAMLTTNSWAASLEEDESVRAGDWLRAVEISGVPSDVLFAMSLKESGTTFNRQRAYAPWPWVLNIEEKAHYYLTKQKALEALRSEVEKGNERVAVGMYQIYLKYNGHRVEDVLTLMDPTTNLLVAAEVLRDCGKRYQPLVRQLSCYYSGDDDQEGMDYAQSVIELTAKYGEPYALRSTDEPRLRVDELVSQYERELDDHARFLRVVNHTTKRRGVTRKITIRSGDEK